MEVSCIVYLITVRKFKYLCKYRFGGVLCLLSLTPYPLSRGKERARGKRIGIWREYTECLLI